MRILIGRAQPRLNITAPNFIMRKGIPRKKAIAGKDRIIPHKGHEFRLEMPKEGRFLPEVKIEIDGSNAFCSRGHRWVPGPIQRQGIYKRMIGILEEYEKEMFMERNGFENYRSSKAVNS